MLECRHNIIFFIIFAIVTFSLLFSCRFLCSKISNEMQLNAWAFETVTFGGRQQAADIQHSRESKANEEWKQTYEIMMTEAMHTVLSKEMINNSMFQKKIEFHERNCSCFDLNRIFLGFTFDFLWPRWIRPWRWNSLFEIYNCGLKLKVVMSPTHCNCNDYNKFHAINSLIYWLSYINSIIMI